VNVTPLLDVVFIMLIFFIVTASFIKETGIDLARFDAPMKRQSDSTSKKSERNPARSAAGAAPALRTCHQRCAAARSSRALPIRRPSPSDPPRGSGPRA
jgi:hypothetical protein